jgi:primosomal protein N' (replication factor Y)
VINLHDDPPEGQDIREVLQLLEEEPCFTERDLQWLQWASQYYLYPLGKAMRTAFPPGFQTRSQKLVRLTERGLAVFREGLAHASELAVIDENRGLPLSKLVRRCGEAKASEMIARWLERGWVEFSEISGWSRPKRRSIRFVSLSSEGRRLMFLSQDLDRKVGSRQLKILRLLMREEELSVVEVERVVPGARGSLTGLEKRGLLASRYQESPVSSLDSGPGKADPPPTLTPHQEEAMGKIRDAITKGTFCGFLLWGVTGSGKTEIYLRSAEICLRKGRQILLLVPEISLTHQLVREFLARFGDCIGVLHSRLSQGERAEMWRAIHQSEAPIVLGARSAMFAPFRSLGLIIVDEEHDESYKQEEGFRYHARSLALMRGKLSDCVVVLGSATPSLETCYNAERRKLAWLKLPERIEGRPLPCVEIVDLRGQRRRPGSRVLSTVLQEAMEDTLSKGEQVLLFLNRRGYATFLQCPDCGYVFQCQNCSVSLVYHRTDSALRCHYCGWCRPAPALCPECQSVEVMDLGLGTETLEEAVMRRFPSARLLRMDRDTTARKHAHREILRTWRRGEADVLIGTQMVAKGHHVPNVTLVGVVLADVSLNLPDFRSSERTFQLLLQVAGRAGRGDRPGQVIIQTYNPHHPSVHFSITQDFHSFVKYELKAREVAGYPPFRHLVLFRITGPAEDHTAATAKFVGEWANKLCQNRRGLRCLGPSPAPLSRLKGRYRWNILLKGESRAELHLAARHILESTRPRLPSKRVRLTIDVDPQSFL